MAQPNTQTQQNNRQEHAKKPNHPEGSATSTTAHVGIPYTARSTSSRSHVKVQFRLRREVYGVVRENVVNVSAFLRGLVFEALNHMPFAYSLEEQKLEVEIAGLLEELEKVHRWQSLLMKHGSYAEAYLEELKGGRVSDRKPFYVQKPRPDVKPEEFVVVKEIVDYRETLAKQLLEMLNRIIALKKGQLGQNREQNEAFMDYVRRSQSSKRLVDKPRAEKEVKQQNAT